MESEVTKSFDPAREFDLSGRVAMVTGAGSGLGRHFALVLADAGANLVLCGRRQQPLEDTAKLIQSKGGSAIFTSLDVTDEDQIGKVFEEISAQTGTPEILINNAGVNRPSHATSVSANDWDAVVDTNLKGCFLVAKTCAARLMEEGKTGSIINVASILGLRAQKEVSPYMASKAGLIHLSRGLALEWANYGIRVNVLAPGFFHSEMADEYLDSPPGKKLMQNVPQKRAGQWNELNGPLMLLASDAGSYMTGSVLVADGGHSVNSL
jgi:NAD(P)-dependent dehydrogenase (short-subunit alcohol dehydrogenase family)